MSADKFTAEKLAWLDKLSAALLAAGAPSSAFHLFYEATSNFLDKDKFNSTCKLSMRVANSWIEERFNISDRAARRLITLVDNTGLIKPERRGGKGKSINSYVLVSNPAKIGRLSAQTRTQNAPKPGQKSPPNPLEEIPLDKRESSDCINAIGRRKRAFGGSRPAPAGEPIPEDWQADDALMASIRAAMAFLPYQVAREQIRFKSHHLERGGLSLDWGASFMKWLVRALDIADEKGCPIRWAPEQWAESWRKYDEAKAKQRSAA
jgi:hypothetical protein